MARSLIGRASVFGTEGWTFESVPVHHFIFQGWIHNELRISKRFQSCYG